MPHPRDDRPGQPVYDIAQPPRPGETRLRPATIADLGLLVPACAAAHREVSSKEAAAWREELMPSLPAIAALGIAEIQPETLTIPQLTVKPLVVAPIDDGNHQR